MRTTTLAAVLLLAATSIPAASPAPTAATAGVAPADSLADLPLTVLPATAPGDSTLAVLITGDGGWATLDRTVADSLVHHGIPVVGLNSRTYLSTPRDPGQAARDVARILRTYLPAFGKSRVVLVGYSRGADMMPFVVTRLPAELRERVAVVALMGAAPNVNFKFHLIDLITNKHRKDDLMTVPEIEKVHGPRVLCFYGEDEKESACRALAP
ncbi:MAG: cutinase family protein, partial [Gemmatimonadaceae bacterium]|nr:cutinase family protein [Gemmatimonadaceae bacterium]